MSRSRRIGAVVAGAVLLCAGTAHAVNIVPGTYRLHNHPDGNAQPPLYGARLDELYNATGNDDIFTFNFDHPSSAMYMVYNGASIHIYGQSYGGLDVGSIYASSPPSLAQYTGMYTFDFTYSQDVLLVPGDDDVYVEPPNYYENSGYVITPLGHNIELRDGHYDGGAQLDFRLGDENNDLGHRGFSGISGWGWLFHGPPGSPYIGSSDWLFTAELVPAPGTTFVLFGAGVMASRRRRR